MKNGTIFIQKPAKSRSVYVLSGFGYDPMYDGKLTCIMSKLRNMTLYRILNLNSDVQINQILTSPEIIYKPAAVDMTPESRENMAIMDFQAQQMNQQYPNQNAPTTNLREYMSKLMENDRMMMVKARQQQTEENNELLINNPLMRTKQSSQIMPLNADILFDQTLPVRRTDWRDINSIIGDTIASVFGNTFIFFSNQYSLSFSPPSKKKGIPWQYVSSLATRYARSVGHVEITDVTLRVTVNDWRDIISHVYTEIFNIHLNEDVANPIRIRFSTYHREEFEMLEKKRSFGIITDDEYITMSRSEMGLDVLDQIDELKKRLHERDEEKKQERKEKSKRDHFGLGRSPRKKKSKQSPSDEETTKQPPQSEKAKT